MERGKLVEVTETVLIAKPNQQYTFRWSTIPLMPKPTYALFHLDNRTEMIQTVEFFPKGFMMKLMMPIVKGAMKKQMANELINFKNFIETKS